MSGSRSTARIRTLDDLNRETLQNIFRAHFKNKELIVKKLPPELEGLSGNNDFYNSDIRMLRIDVIRDPDDIDDVDEETSDSEDLEHVEVVIKVPVGSDFAKMMQKIARPFMKEYLWYSRALPMLSRISPRLKTLAPTCYHAYSNFGDDFAPTGCEKRCCLLCWMPLRKRESGMLILENLTKRPKGKEFRMLDKDKVRAENVCARIIDVRMDS